MEEKFFYINNTKLVNVLKKNGELYIAGKEYSLDVFQNKSKKNIYIIFKLEFTGKPALHLIPLDFLILDAVYNIYTNSKKYRNIFSLRQLYFVIAGEENKAVSPSRLEMLGERVNNLMNTLISIDFRAEAKKRGVMNFENCIIKAPLLPLTPKGKKYQINEIPPLYQYSDINKQVITVPLERYHCITKDKKVVKDTIRNLMIKYYLSKELEIIKSTRNKGKYKISDIYFFKQSLRHTEADDGIITRLHIDKSRSNNTKYWFSETGNVIKCKTEIGKYLNEPSVRHTISDIAEEVEKILEFYKEINYIKGYEIEYFSMRKNGKGMPVRITNIEFVDEETETDDNQEDGIDEKNEKKQEK